MATETKAPDNDRVDAVRITKADGSYEDMEIPAELQPKPIEVSLSQETIEALGAAIGKALKKR